MHVPAMQVDAKDADTPDNWIPRCVRTYAFASISWTFRCVDWHPPPGPLARPTLTLQNAFFVSQGPPHFAPHGAPPAELRAPA